ncbi:hypothetical protein ACHAXR_000587, partial [Thalassiosira sp. AJA248-18]
PEHVASVVSGDGSGSGAPTDDLLVACLGPNATNDHTHPGAGGRVYGRDQGRTLRHVYAASPTTGVLCVWVLDTNLQRGNSAADSFVECDASVRLKLKAGEALTVLTPMSESSMEGNVSSTWLLAATSLGRLWKIYKTSRPLTLHAKLVKRKMLVDSINPSEEGEEDSGIVRGLYNYFATPSKKSATRDDHAMDEGNDGTSDDNEKIVALFPMQPISNEEGNAEDTSNSPRKSPVRGPPPRKQQRISAPSADSSACAVSLSSSLVVKEWKISSLAGSENVDVEGSSLDAKEGYVTRNALFPRYDDGTLNLENLQPKSNNAQT